LGFLLTFINAARQVRLGRLHHRNISQSTAMSTPIRAAILFAALVMWLPARAQYLGLGVKTNLELTKQDLETIHRTVDEKVHGKAVGTTAKWSNPASGNSGKIQLAKKFTRNGQQCETLAYTLRTKRRPVTPEHYRLSSCLQPDGQWRLI
jgi:surface antigen